MDTLFARFRDAEGRDIIGPSFSYDEAACRRCLAARLASCGLPAPTFVPFPGAPAHLRDALRDQAAYNDRDTLSRQVRFVPLPECRCLRARMSYQPSLDLRMAVSAIFGPVRRIDYAPAPDGWTLAIAQGARLHGTSGAPIAAIGSATDPDPDMAAARAVAETLERYAAGFWDPDRISREPGAPPLVHGQDCATGAMVMVPAAAVFLPFDPALPADAAGLAAGANVRDATARALAERIERDVARDFFVDDATAAGALDGDQVLLGHDSDHEVWLTLRRAAAPPYTALGLGASRDRADARAKSRAEARHVAAHMARLAAQSGASQGAPPTPDGLGWLDAAVLRLAFDRDAGRRLHARLEDQPAHAAARTSQPRRAMVEVTTADVAMYGLRVVRVVTLED